MQACGVSPFRLLRPVAFVAVWPPLATAHQIIVALPDANQTFREITFNVVANRAESNVKPRVFYGEFPNRTIYARDVVPGGWRDVFLADTSQPGETTVYFAKEGRLRVDREKRLVALELTDGTWHTTSVAKPDEYEGGDYDSTIIHLDPNTVFPSSTPTKTDREMSIAELRASIAAGAKLRRSGPQSAVHDSAEVFDSGRVAGAGADRPGARHQPSEGWAVRELRAGLRRDFRLLRRAVDGARRRHQRTASGRPGRVDPERSFSASAGVALLFWRAGSADQPIRISIPAFWRRRRAATRRSRAGPGRRAAGVDRRSCSSIRVPHLNLPRPGLLDLYVSGQYLRVFFLGLFSLLGIFYISTFMDLADKLFRGVGDERHDAALLLLPDAAVRLLRHSDGGARGDARDDRSA